MATRVQFRRGTTAEHANFTGAIGEVTVDTDKEVVVVHDGTTAGGFPVARENLSNATEASVTAKVAAASTSVAGKVQLTDSISSTSITTAATPNSVKQAYDLANSGAKLNVAQTFTAAQRGSVTVLTSGATVTPDFAVANNFSLVLGQNVILANPTNLTAGQSGAIIITQAAAGGPFTVAFGNSWKFPGGTAPTKTVTASSVCVVAYLVESASRITAKMLNDVK